ncbi:MAG: nicotinate-nucleotide diphosphorylase (carboxylating) [Ignavibacteriae bacterium HGW-Ignavibacteriae-2]|jgi:nicotinate-nucleotide pyrophosphorylase (carboxylating)|nr:MAG: nicotinate-nucleotide diphosphorylase (carboxylating) [Ignavibacteriae bacterium HGW-Ignavibacteriae-2]
MIKTNIISLTDIKLNLGDSKEVILRALVEDIAQGDITSKNIIPEDKSIKAFIKTKEDGIIAGLEIAKLVFDALNENVSITANFKDGDTVKSGDIIAELSGSYRAILTGERTALNFLQRMSGIATKTNMFVNAVKPYDTKILDTRKTAPGLRLLDKMAVRLGGGVNHRLGLYDMVMIKDNHIKVAGGIKNAVNKIKQSIGTQFKIEVETSKIEEVIQAVESEVDIIMLDNMTTEIMRESVKLIAGRALTEASGNMTLERVQEVAQCGVDFISVGALTHSVEALDIGLYIRE